jgi:hypothetical protein
MKSSLALFEEQPDSRAILDKVCLARKFVEPVPVSHRDFAVWCLGNGLSFADTIMATYPGLFVMHGRLMHCKQFGSRKQRVRVVAVWRGHVGKHKGLHASELLAWFLRDEGIVEFVKGSVKEAPSDDN